MGSEDILVLVWLSGLMLGSLVTLQEYSSFAVILDRADNDGDELRMVLVLC